LHQERSDPRRRFAESLLAALSDEGPIVVYTAYENTILNALVDSLPDLAPSIARLQDRLFDLEKLIHAQVQHPLFHGRTSLKSVLPALVDDLSYDHLAIADGGVASMRYAQAVFGDLPDDDRRAVFSDLREYCATDTLGLVRLYETLCEVC
jgi:hypothetical protein